MKWIALIQVLVFKRVMTVLIQVLIFKRSNFDLVVVCLLGVLYVSIIIIAKVCLASAKCTSYGRLMAV